jgi:hypothetical protein
LYLIVLPFDLTFPPGSSVTTVSGTSIGNATESELECEEKRLRLGQKDDETRYTVLGDIDNEMDQYIKFV